MKKNIIKIVFTFVMFMILVLNISMAAVEMTPNPSSWDPTDTTASEKAEGVLATAINISQIVGVGIAVIMLTYVGIKYMMESPEGKADYKKSASAYIIGAIVLFGVAGILGIIKSFADGLFPSAWW